MSGWATLGTYTMGSGRELAEAPPPPPPPTPVVMGSLAGSSFLLSDVRRYRDRLRRAERMRAEEWERELDEAVDIRRELAAGMETLGVVPESIKPGIKPGIKPAKAFNAFNAPPTYDWNSLLKAKANVTMLGTLLDDLQRQIEADEADEEDVELLLLS